MQFNSVEFLFFFPIVLAVYFVIPRKGRKGWLLLASYVFYMCWNAAYALLIGASTVITYNGGKRLAALSVRSRRRKHVRGRKKAVVIVCVGLNLAILALFKYGNFFLQTAGGLSALLGGPPVTARLNLLLPVGISFYTFQALGYLIDVYRGDVEAEQDFYRYALFVSFFPQLVAGPIERSGNLLRQMRQIEEIRLWNAKRVASGAVLMLWGYFMKMVIADRAAIVADTVFGGFRMLGGAQLTAGALAFALQIYCDFASYSLIAIGAAKILGFTLTENFDTPYFALSIREFWARWHISLSTWLRDYLYIPLGGSRRGKVRKAVNLMVVFLASGLWHGAAWHFVLWGAIHGALRVLGEALAPLRRRVLEGLWVRTDCFSWKLLRAGMTFAAVTLAWIFFRAETAADAVAYIGRIFGRFRPWQLFDGSLYKLGLDSAEAGILFFSAAALFLVDLLKRRRGLTLDRWLSRQNLWFTYLAVIALILAVLTFGQYGPAYDPRQFIYFRF